MYWISRCVDVTVSFMLLEINLYNKSNNNIKAGKFTLWVPTRIYIYVMFFFNETIAATFRNKQQTSQFRGNKIFASQLLLSKWFDSVTPWHLECFAQLSAFWLVRGPTWKQMGGDSGPDNSQSQTSFSGARINVPNSLDLASERWVLCTGSATGRTIYSNYYLQIFLTEVPSQITNTGDVFRMTEWILPCFSAWTLFFRFI